MREAPHYLRLSRALALGALASPLVHCMPTQTQGAAGIAQRAPDPNSGSRTQHDRSPQDAARAGDVRESPTLDSAAEADPTEVVAGQSSRFAHAEVSSQPTQDGATCARSGTLRVHSAGRALQRCQCQVQGERPGQLPPRWRCTTNTRLAGGIDGQSCEVLGVTDSDTGRFAEENLCVCVASAGRQEHACYHAFDVTAGPLAPPELAREA